MRIVQYALIEKRSKLEISLVGDFSLECVYDVYTFWALFSRAAGHESTAFGFWPGYNILFLTLKREEECRPRS